MQVLYCFGLETWTQGTASNTSVLCLLSLTFCPCYSVAWTFLYNESCSYWDGVHFGKCALPQWKMILASKDFWVYGNLLCLRTMKKYLVKYLHTQRKTRKMIVILFFFTCFFVLSTAASTVSWPLWSSITHKGHMHCWSVRQYISKYLPWWGQISCWLRFTEASITLCCFKAGDLLCASRWFWQ